MKVLAALLVLLSASAASAELRTRPPRKVRCELFTDRDFAGERLPIPDGGGADFGSGAIGSTAFRHHGDFWNDQVSSARVPQGCTLRVYEHELGQGEEKAWSGVNVRYVGDRWNDRISSARCSCN